jgi:hypothetical protein
LESVYAREGIEGSNPSLSAMYRGSNQNLRPGTWRAKLRFYPAGQSFQCIG